MSQDYTPGPADRRPPSAGTGRYGTLRLAGQAVAGLERVLMALSSLIMMTIMLVIVVDVLCRYFLNAPLAWAFDVISLYLMAALFFFALSDTLRYDRHVSVDLFRAAMSPRVRSACDLVIGVVALAFFLVILDEGASTAWDAFQAGDRLVGTIPWPTWIYYVLVPIGAATISLRLAVRSIGHGIALVSGEATAEEAVAYSEGESHHGKGAQA